MHRGSGVRRALYRRAARAGRRGPQLDSHRRQGWRCRRHVVLEPLPGCDVRHRGLRLHALVRGDGLCADREVRPPARDLQALTADRREARPLQQGLLRRDGHEHGVGRGLKHVDHPHQSRRQVPGTVRGGQLWGPHGRQVARSEGRRVLPGAHVPHIALGLFLHRRLLGGRPEQARGQEGRHHRHRRHSSAGHPPLGRGRQAAVRVPAHALIG
mmetsp:Transcript_28457/g.64550  ORF Transcript_28457/g.64550 Transcript_28457/m.64550 type:complete len:213 (-) Transcript_28457:1188-1826(-)